MWDSWGEAIFDLLVIGAVGYTSHQRGKQSAYQEIERQKQKEINDNHAKIISEFIKRNEEQEQEISNLKKKVNTDHEQSIRDFKKRFADLAGPA